LLASETKDERNGFFESIAKNDFGRVQEAFPSIPEEILRKESVKFYLYWTETDMR